MMPFLPRLPFLATNFEVISSALLLQGGEKESYVFVPGKDRESQYERENTRCQSYDRELQRRRCKHLQRN
jgi:hypothetical protein